ncbi:nitrile hydratase [Rhizobiales bacterium GAS191]|jgi:nitrile hydratase beta subunit|nr:nitrile hydratase [Rhizobiales bacterium GAS113]SEB98758.1 nitrile hydratase [Rhizobiales bacterium GAS188]SED24296.1 nitrile hydratase [Rhizobiales bacterium GAS191]
MNGAQDLGGAMGFGPVEHEANEPVFHAPWEARALAVTVAAGGLGEWSIDQSRHAREILHPGLYLNASYYEIWLRGLERLLQARGLVDAQELGSGHSARPAAKTRRPRVAAADVPEVLAKGTPFERTPLAPARFAIGQGVRAKVMHPAGHTRLPRYARGKAGVVERVHGAHIFPDTSGPGTGEPVWLYTVAFPSRELWGETADPTLTVSIEAFEPYLDPA